MASKNGDSPLRIQCPACSGVGSKVAYTLAYPRYIYRLRKCANPECGKTFKTMEAIVPEGVPVPTPQAYAKDKAAMKAGQSLTELTTREISRVMNW